MTVCISCMSEEQTLQAKKESPFYILSPKLVYSKTEEVYTKTIEGNICIKKMVIGQCDLQTLYYIQGSNLPKAKL